MGQFASIESSRFSILSLGSRHGLGDICSVEVSGPARNMAKKSIEIARRSGLARSAESINGSKPFCGLLMIAR
jgi:hypothetical protein